MSPSAACHCGSGRELPRCCGPYLKGDALPDTPEQLMRSRYSAFCEHNAQYLVGTHHPKTRSPELAESLQQTFSSTRWLGLRVLQSCAEAADGEVEFVAFFKPLTQTGEPAAGPPAQVHELSRFVWDERWLYLDGAHLKPVSLERNSPCICGSGRKYKKCCAL